MEKVFLCLDFGTESVRGELINHIGISKCSSTKAYNILFSQGGRVEQSAEELWMAAIAVCKKLNKRASELGLEVEAICIDATACSLMFLDCNKNPLGNIMSWMDIRASEVCKRYECCNGQKVPATWMPGRVRWVIENEPERYESAAFICELLDWIYYKLTGRLTVNKNIATLKWYFNYYDRKGWPHELYDNFGIGSVLEKIAEDIVEPGEIIGTVSNHTSSELGFSNSPFVVVGGADAFIGMIGMNSISIGSVAIIGGSSHVILCHTSSTIQQAGLFGPFPDALIKGFNVIEGSQTSTGSTLRWFVDNFMPKLRHDYVKLDAMAESIEAGSQGLLVLDHWQGNRSPFTNDDSRGVIRGLTLAHRPIHIYRAIIEGCAIGTAVIVDTLKNCNYEVKKIIIGGGITNSPLWMQVHAETLGTSVFQSEKANVSLMGCAILAAYACGYYTSIFDAASSMQPNQNKIEPNSTHVQIYRDLKSRYLETYWKLYDKV